MLTDRTSMWRVLLYLTGIARFVTVFLIFYFPLPTTIIQLLLDSADGYISYKAKVAWDFYGIYDKLLDYWWYIFILLYSVRIEFFNLLLVLFIIRSVGQFAFLFSRKYVFLLLFPNVFEVFFWFYLIQINFFPNLTYLFSGFYEIYLFFAILLIVLVREYYLYHLHVKRYNHKPEKWPPFGFGEDKLLDKIFKYFKLD